MFDLKTRNRKFKTQNKYANIRIKQPAVLVRILWFIITTLRIPKVKLELSWWLNKIAKSNNNLTWRRKQMLKTWVKWTTTKAQRKSEALWKYTLE